MVWAATAAIVVSAGVSLYEGSQQQGIANQELGLAQSTQAKQNYYNNQLMQLMADPSSIYKNPAFTSANNLALTGAAHAGAASWGPNSGSEAAGLVNTSNANALSFLNQQESLLAGLSGANAPTSAGSAYSGASGAATAAAGQFGSLLYGAGYMLGNKPTTAQIGSMQPFQPPDMNYTPAPMDPSIGDIPVPY